MTYAPTNPVDVPPYQLQSIISSVIEDFGFGPGHTEVRCAQALGSEIYVGCSNGELIRFALQADDPNKLESYTVLSRQTIANEKPIDEIVLVPGLSRAFILSDRTLHFYTLPSLDPVSLQTVKPIRHVVTFAVDQEDLSRPVPTTFGPVHPPETVHFCIIKRTAIAMYAMRERLSFLKAQYPVISYPSILDLSHLQEIPLPQGATLARRIGRSLCIADKENYNVVDLESAQLFPIIQISQAEDRTVPVKPSITIVGQNEFLILSWTGASTMGLFITGGGDPVRGTLEWPSHPDAVCLDYPYVTALLPNGTIEIHSIETQSIVQVISPPPSSRPTSPAEQSGTRSRSRLNLISSLDGYLVPSTQKSDKMRSTKVSLLRAPDPVNST